MTSIYVVATGQNDNLGDSLLRKGYLDTLRRVGELHVLLHGSSEDYISGLGLGPHDVVHRSRRQWELALLRAAVSRSRPMLALNAGEGRVNAAHEYVGSRLALLARVVSLCGGSVVQAGLGIREAPSAAPSKLLRTFLARCDLVTWRDAESARVGGVGLVQPDWAFALDLDVPKVERSTIVVSMRGDRAVGSQQWFDAVRRLADDLEAGIVVVSQVRRDDDRSREIAETLGSGAVVDLWERGDHARRLDELTVRYASAQVIVSDRLHALVLGALCGAAPVGLTTGTAEKLRRTLEPAGLATWVYDADQVAAAAPFRRDEAQLAGAVGAARAALRSVEQRLDSIARRQG